MNEMRDVGDWLERDLRAVERATSRRTARLKRFGTALLALFLRFALILLATRFVEDILDFVRQRAHSRLLGWPTRWPDFTGQRIRRRPPKVRLLNGCGLLPLPLGRGLG